MNTVHYIERRKTPRNTTTYATAVNATAAVRVHRERDFGVGYGSSSGYGASRRYADSRGGTYFRCR